MSDDFAPDPEHSAAQASIADRRHARNSLFLLADCRMPQRGQGQRVKVRNLSASGMMAEGPVVAVVGELVSLDLRNIGWVEGTVAWVRDNRFGVAFAGEIDPALVRQNVSLTPSDDPDLRSYYQRGPLGVLARPDEMRPERLRLI
jgi:hypothetical protein